MITDKKLDRDLHHMRKNGYDLEQIDLVERYRALCTTASQFTAHAHCSWVYGHRVWSVQPPMAEVLRKAREYENENQSVDKRSES